MGDGLSVFMASPYLLPSLSPSVCLSLPVSAHSPSPFCLYAFCMEVKYDSSFLVLHPSHAFSGSIEQ